MTDTQPWKDQFSIERVEIVEETPDLRVLHMTLNAGEKVPWHWHSKVTDRFFCLAGRVEVESRAPRDLHSLRPGDSCAMDPMVAHEVRNVGSDTAKLIVVQGVGAYDYHPVGREAGATE
ncbi:MAG: cupin domain-containing protein [Alphaproteobacteria bacterium]